MAKGISAVVSCSFPFFTIETNCFHSENHFDSGDRFSDAFTEYALEYIMRCLKTSQTQSFEDSEDAQKKILHLFRLATMCGEDIFFWTLPTTCGYSPVLRSGRQASALFHYDSLNVAIRIPMNVISYHTWFSHKVKHCTGIVSENPILVW